MSKSFKHFLQNGGCIHLKEGGNAIKTSSRINQLNVEDTLSDIYERLFGGMQTYKLSKKDSVVLGSTGKKDPKKNGTAEGSSGDIDIAVLYTGPDMVELLSEVASVGSDLGYDVKVMEGLGITSVGWPIVNSDGKQKADLVQVDIIPVESLEWAEWAYYSPSFDESEYKGLFANEFLFYSARLSEFKELKKDDDGDLVEWERMFFDLAKGLMKGKQSRIGKSGKTIKTVTTTDKEVITLDPQKACDILFGEGFNKQDTRTVTGIISILENSKCKLYEKRHEIYDGVITGLKKKDQPIPPELQDVKE